MAYNSNNPNGQATMANSSPVVIASNQSPLPITGSVAVINTLPTTDVFGTGTLGALNAAVTVTSNGISGCIINIRGTLVGTVVLEGSTDGFTNAQNISVLNLSTGLNQSSGMTAAGYYRGINAAAWTQLRIRVSVYTSGTSTGTINLSQEHNVFTVVQQQASNLNMTATVSTLPAEGVVSATNSSTATLGIGGVFTGTAVDITNYSSISVLVISNVASATDGLSIQQSSDGTNWDNLDVYTIPAATGKNFGVQCVGTQLRVVYTNGGTGQGSFRLQTILHKNMQRGSSVRPQDGRTNDNDFGEYLSYLMAYNSGSNAWDRLKAVSGSLTVTKPDVLFRGRSATFRTPGRAGTAGQNLMSIHNATASPIKVNLNKVTVDLVQTVIKAITVLPPIIRLWKVTVLPTNGTALTKNKVGGTTTSNAAVTVLGDASADGTGSGTTLTATLPAGTFISQEYAPRFITAAGYEPSDRIEFLSDTYVTLNALEGIVVTLSYTLATQNPTSDMWIVGMEWDEIL